MLQNVGKMRIPEVSGKQKITPVNDHTTDDYCRGVQWPMCLNAGDISRDGKILIRNYECKYNLFNITITNAYYSIYRQISII